MITTPLQWIEIAGARDPFADGASVLERARIEGGQPANFKYRSEASLAEWIATAPRGELADESARFVRLAIPGALVAVRAARNSMKDGSRRANDAATDAAIAANGARESRARIGIARYVAVAGAIRFAEDAGFAAAGMDLPHGIGHAEAASDAAAAIADALALGMRIASAEERSADRLGDPPRGIALTDIPAVRQTLVSLEARRGGDAEMKGLISRIEEAAGLVQNAMAARER